jgi:hypothetical protein
MRPILQKRPIKRHHRQSERLKTGRLWFFLLKATKQNDLFGNLSDSKLGVCGFLPKATKQNDLFGNLSDSSLGVCGFFAEGDYEPVNRMTR